MASSISIISGVFGCIQVFSHTFAQAQFSHIKKSTTNDRAFMVDLRHLPVSQPVSYQPNLSRISRFNFGGMSLRDTTIPASFKSFCKVVRLIPISCASWVLVQGLSGSTNGGFLKSIRQLLMFNKLVE